MNNIIKGIIGTSIVIGSIFGGTQSAKAEYRYCGNIVGYPVCVIDRVYIDSLSIRWTDGDYTHIGVRCGTGQWELNGYNPGRSEVNKIVSYWCY